jgi:uncharacterized protein (UPF0548 family)
MTHFNHDTAGMTNPSLHIAVDNQVVMHVSATKGTNNNNNNNNNNNDDWWPEPTTTTACHTAGWRVMEYRRSHVGWGRACYEAVRDKVLAWEFDGNHQGIVALQDTVVTYPRMQQQQQQQQPYTTVVPTGATAVDDHPSSWHSTCSALSIGDCPRLATYTRFGRMAWILNPVQVVYDWVDQRGPCTTYTSTAYATCRGHGLVGEERVTVALRDSGRVDVQVISYSKAAKWYTNIAFGPLIHKMQHRFFTNQLQFLQTVASDATTDETAAAAHDDDDGMTLPLLLAKPMPVPMQEPLLLSLPMTISR